MHIHELPVETLLQIIGYLPIQSICVLEYVSQTFHELIKVNLNAIYERGAILHRFAPQNTAQCGSQDALKCAMANLGPKNWLHGIDDWKQFCKNSFLLEQAWSFSYRGVRPTYQRMETLSSSWVRRHGDFTVDEVERTAIFSTKTGEIEVVAIETGEHLWKLDGDQTAQPRFLQAGSGFLIFSRGGRKFIDVWRRSADFYDPNSYLPSRPTDAQLAQSPDAAIAFSHGYPPLDGSSNSPTSPAPTTSSLRAAAQLPRRGVPLPFAQIAYHQQFRLCRYTHPHLALVRDFFPKRGSSTIDVWHIPTLQRLARFCVDKDIGIVTDMAIGATSLYISTGYRVVAYNWASAMSDESGEPVFLPAYSQFVMPQSDAEQPSTFLWERINQGGSEATDGDAASRQNFVQFIPFGLPTNLKQTHLERDRYEFLWMGPHFSRIATSPDGKDLVAIFKVKCIVYIPNFSSRGSTSGKSDNKDSQIVFAFGIGREIGANNSLRTFSSLTHAIDSVAFDGNRLLLRGGNEMFAIVVKDKRYLGAAGHTEPSSLHLKPPFTLCGFKQPNVSMGGHSSWMQLLNGSVWFPTPCDDTQSRISYVDFADFDGAVVESDDSRAHENEDGHDGEQATSSNP
ncbi:hypothetical protein FS837_001826 [Tulasnella sp. UAMH 9824]|nr:hypothetical protein FS837_001826 [Tulasnella sp. UAMH 9824]